MRSLPFTALVLAVYAMLLGLRFGMERYVPSVVTAEVAAAPDAVMALPPKPEGLGSRARGEGDGTAVIDEATCRRMAVAVRDVCWQALARQEAPLDVEGALGRCALVSDTELALECRADVAETITIDQRERAVAICVGIDSRKWRGQCHFGLGLALAETDPAWAFGRCDHAETFYRFCRHDVIGEVALVDVDAAVAACAREEGDELTRKTCWHGIGKYLARRDFSEAAAACARATPQWQGNCFHGVGWGAAERDPDTTITRCTDQGPFEDNCRHGAANQQKRADPERAVALCGSIRREEIRSACLRFVKL